MSVLEEITYEDYVSFCKAFQEQNLFEFNEKDIVQEESGEYRYVASYRDEDNYKTFVFIYYNPFDKYIYWNVQDDDWDDVHQEIEELFESMFGCL